MLRIFNFHCEDAVCGYLTQLGLSWRVLQEQYIETSTLARNTFKHGIRKFAGYSAAHFLQFGARSFKAGFFKVGIDPRVRNLE